MAEEHQRESDEQKGKHHASEHDVQSTREAQGQVFGGAFEVPALLPLAASSLDRRQSASVRSEVMRRAQQTHGNRAVQRFMSSYGNEEEEDDQIARRIESAAGSGSSLDAGVRSQLEGGLGANLEGVRVHTGKEADDLARSVQSVAFTSGQDIFFREGAYNPSSPEGRKLIAHETTHTIQQSRGSVDGTPAPGGVSISDPSDQYEQAAEEAAEMVMQMPPMPRGRLDEELMYTPMQRSVQRYFSASIPDARPASAGQPQPGPLDEVGAGISQLGGVLGGAYGDMGGIIGSQVGNLGGALGGGIGNVSSTLGGLGARGGGIFGDMVSNYGSAVGSLGARGGSMLGGGVSRIEDMLGLGTGIGDTITDGAGLLGGAASGIGQFAGDTISRGAGVLGGLASDIGSGIGGAVSSTADFIGGNISRNTRNLGNMGAGITSGIGDFVGGLDDFDFGGSMLN